MQLLTSEPVVLPVSVADLEKYLNGTDDGFYETALQMAGEYFVTSTGIELLERQYTGRLLRDSTISSGVYPVNRHQPGWVELPMWPVIAIDSMTADGAAVLSPELDKNVKPARLYVGGAQDVTIIATFGHDVTTITTSGYGIAVADSGHGHTHGGFVIDERICTAILMLAGFIVEHRGACDLTEAASKSGAAMLMNQLKLYRVTI